MTDPAVVKYYQKRRLVYERKNQRIVAEMRVRFLEDQFRATSRLIEFDKWMALQDLLGDAYMELMRLRKVKAER